MHWVILGMQLEYQALGTRQQIHNRFLPTRLVTYLRRIALPRVCGLAYQSNMPFLAAGMTICTLKMALIWEMACFFTTVTGFSLCSVLPSHYNSAEHTPRSHPHHQKCHNSALGVTMTNELTMLLSGRPFTLNPGRPQSCPMDIGGTILFTRQ